MPTQKASNDMRPTESSNIGRITKEQIKKCLKSKEGCLVITNLHDVSINLFETTTLNSVASMLIKNNDQSMYRFGIEIGHNNYHTTAFNKDLVDEESFVDMISKFYRGNFHLEEAPRIESAMDLSDICHIVIYFYYYIKTPTKEQILKKKVIAAASFVIGKESSFLFYIGVSDLKYNSNEIINKFSDSPKNNPTFRAFNLGTLLICLLQKSTYMTIDRHNIVCQVYNDVSKGAVLFYQKIYFKIVRNSHPLINEFTEQYPYNVYDDKNLVYMIPQCPIYLVHPFYVRLKVALKFMKFVIDNGCKYLLNVKFLESDDCRMFKIKRLSKDVHDLFKEKHSSLNNFVFRQVDNNTVYQLDEEKNAVADSNLLLSILKEYLNDEQNKFALVDVYSGQNITEAKSCIYMIMSYVLFGTTTQYKNLRMFMYHILHSMTQNKENSCCNYKDEKKKNTLIHQANFLEFQQDVLLAAVKLKTFYGDTEFKRLGLLDIEDSVLDIAINNDVYIALCHLAVCQLRSSYTGGEFELNLFASIFNIEFVFLSGLSMSVDDNQTREWKLSLKTKEVYKFIPNNSGLSSKQKCLVYMHTSENGVYKIFGFQKDLAKIDFIYDETVVNWLNERDNKCIEKLRNQKFIIQNNRKEIGYCFDIDDYHHPSIKEAFRLSLAKVTDPLKDWIDRKYQLVKGLDFLDPLSCRPTTYTGSTLLSEYATKILFPISDSIFILHPENTFAFSQGTRDYRPKLEQKLQNYGYIVVLVNHGENHWVVFQFEKPNEKVEKLTVQVADSLNVEGPYGIEYFHEEALYTISELFIDMENYYGIDPNELICGVRPSDNELDLKQKRYNAYSECFQFQAAKNVEKQSDSYNCGIHSIMRIEKIVKAENPDDALCNEEFPSPTIF